MKGKQTRTDAIISRTIRGILGFTGMPAEHLWHQLGLSRSTYYNRINGETSWSADDVARAAEVLGVSVADLYDGQVPAGLPAYKKAPATVGGGAKWGGGDSNPEPDGYGVDIALIDFPFPRASVETRVAA